MGSPSTSSLVTTSSAAALAVPAPADRAPASRPAPSVACDRDSVATACAPDVVLLYAGMAAVGFTSIWTVARANTLVQLRAAPELRGRVMGAWTMALPGANPVTGLAMGALADLAGARAAFACAGLLMLAAVAGSWRGLTGTRGPRQEPAGDGLPRRTIAP